MALAAGDKLGPYEIMASIGAGGMGEVYRARDTRLEREVALKILPPEVADDSSRRQRFEMEARTVAALTHPNIVAIYDVGDGYIEAHHLKPISEIEEGATVTYQVATDFAVLCSNCHRMIHKSDDPSNVSELRKIVQTHATLSR